MSEEDRRRDAEVTAAVDRAEELIREGRRPDGESDLTRLAWIALVGTYEDRVRLKQLIECGKEVDPGSDEGGRIVNEMILLSCQAVDRAPSPGGQR
jgi:hypothetical protein